jgi:aspartate aminotransferase
VIEKFRRDNGLAFAPNEISCSAGAKQVLFNAFMATLNPGDEVIIPAPFWTSYADIVSVCGGTPIVVTCTDKDGFRLSGAAFERAITPRTRWLLLNSPSNPTGAAYERQHLAELAEVLMRHPQIWAMSDDIYEHILYDGIEFHTLCGVEPALRSRTLIVNGVSKAYAMTGWRIGYGAGPADLIATMAAVQSQVTSCPSSISQAAAVAALTGPQDIVAERTRSFQHRRDLLVSALNAIEGITCLRPQGAFYTYSSCAGLIGKRAPNGDLIATDSDFCRYLLDAVDVAVVPGSCFGVGPYFRISYAAAEADLIEACARIDRACKALS